jgi:hypothetical protein
MGCERVWQGFKVMRLTVVEHVDEVPVQDLLDVWVVVSLLREPFLTAHQLFLLSFQVGSMLNTAAYCASYINRDP